MAGGGRAVQGATLKAFGLSLWQASTPRLLGLILNASPIRGTRAVEGPSHPEHYIMAMEASPRVSFTPDLKFVDEIGALRRKAYRLFLMVRGFGAEAGMEQLSDIVEFDSEELADNLRDLWKRLEDARREDRARDAS